MNDSSYVAIHAEENRHTERKLELRLDALVRICAAAEPHERAAIIERLLGQIVKPAV